MKKILNSKLVWILVLFLGLLILLYPMISDTWNKYVASQLIVNYTEVVSHIDEVDKDKIFQDAKEYNNGLIGNTVPDAFAFEEANKPNKQYEELLNPTGDGLMGYVEIPVIDVNIPLYHYTSEEVLEKGAGHLPGSSLPIGGDSTHSVISAHRGLPSAKLFTDLDLVEEGDRFYLHIMGNTLAYEVDLIKVILPTKTEDLAIQKGKDYSTLFTCTPYSVNTHRLLVRGHRIEFNQNEYNEDISKETKNSTTMLLMQIASIIIGILLALIIFMFTKRKDLSKKRKEAVILDGREKNNKEKENK